MKATEWTPIKYEVNPLPIPYYVLGVRFLNAACQPCVEPVAFFKHAEEASSFRANNRNYEGYGIYEITE